MWSKVPFSLRKMQNNHKLAAQLPNEAANRLMMVYVEDGKVAGTVKYSPDC